MPLLKRKSKYRYLHLTSPLMRGEDVRRLQIALVKRGHHLTLDGQYGPATKAATEKAAWNLGLERTTGTGRAQECIEDPNKRVNAEKRRAAERALARKKQGSGLHGVITHALTHVGVREVPAGSNRGEPEPDGWEHNFGMTGVSWCGCFAGSMVLAAGGHVDSRVAYVPYIIADAKSRTNGFCDWVPWDGDRSLVQPGWLVTYDWSGEHATGDHVGVVKEVIGSGVIACEGNTGGSNPSDGGMVAITQRNNEFIVGYAKPSF